MKTQQIKDRIYELSRICKNIDGKMNYKSEYIMELDNTMEKIRSIAQANAGNGVDYSQYLIVLQNERNRAMRQHKSFAQDLDSAFSQRERLIKQSEKILPAQRLRVA